MQGRRIKRTVLLLTGLVWVSAGSQAQVLSPPTDSVVAVEKPVPVGPQIIFKELRKEFPPIKQGEVIQHTFLLKNSGNRPLLLSDVKTTCGCTATEWVTDPILPGEIVAIKVTFDSKGKHGVQNKVVTVISNSLTESKAYLTLSTFVEPRVASR